MSVAGFDIGVSPAPFKTSCTSVCAKNSEFIARLDTAAGNLKSVVALARRNGIDVLLNSESKRETPSYVNFGSKQARVGRLLRETLETPSTVRRSYPRARLMRSAPRSVRSVSSALPPARRSPWSRRTPSRI